MWSKGSRPPPPPETKKPGACRTKPQLLGLAGKPATSRSLPTTAFSRNLTGGPGAPLLQSVLPRPRTGAQTQPLVSMNPPRLSNTSSLRPRPSLSPTQPVLDLWGLPSPRLDPHVHPGTSSVLLPENRSA
ncbi:uncharacterized protein LOC122233677 isoform X2 [Panthera tigris]|uniref:uncharacterized protein LOC122233677 isoform X2 n=1 Tax=Panthera tigris TaxID=9694 RepID=UPI001C6FA9AE|nr:uncharacterized protein LOC122233677 isoform X2 [Panthera tigris]